MPADASTAQTVAEAHARLQAHREIQFDLPGAKSEPTPPWVRDLFEWLGQIGQLPGWAIWAIAGVVVLLAALLIAPRVIAARRQRDVAPDAVSIAELRPEAGVARQLLAEAEAMAAAGRYAEAVRLLLHRGLEDIAKRRPRLLRPALTSREIAAAGGLPGPVRDTFAAMAAPVERSLFAGRSLDAAAWEGARDAYRAFALPEAWK